MKDYRQRFEEASIYQMPVKSVKICKRLIKAHASADKKSIKNNKC